MVFRSQVGVAVGVGTPVTLTDSPLVEGAFLELDLSTPAECELLARDKIVPIYMELTELAADNASRGEVPCL